MPDLLATSDTGVSETDNLTRFDNVAPAAALQFLVAGTTPGAVVTLYVDDQAGGSAAAAGPSTLVTLDAGRKLADGAHGVVARQTEAGGTESLPSPQLTITVDTTPSAAPAAADLQAASDTGVSATDNLTADTTPTFSVSAAPYFVISRDGVAQNGPYQPGTSYTSPPLNDAVYAFTLQALDAAGNLSAPSPALSVTVDAAGPAAALAGPLPPPAAGAPDYTFSVAYTDPRGVDVSSLDAQDLRVSGPGVPNLPAMLMSATPEAGGTRVVATYRVNAPSGGWSFRDNGLYVINLQPSQARDAAGNSASGGVLGSFAVDFLAPASTPDLAESTDSGVSAIDDVTNFDNGSPQRALKFLVGGTKPGATVSILVDGTVIGSAVAEFNQTLVTTNGTLALAPGSYRFQSRQTMEGQTPVPDSAGLDVVVDVAPPPRPAAPDLEAASDTGASDADDVTNDNTPTLSVTTPLAPYFRVFRDGTLVSSPYEFGGRFGSAALADGTHVFTVVAVDRAGNASEPGDPLGVTVDTVAPQATGYAGTLDAGFDGDGVYTSQQANIWTSAAFQPDGAVLLAGPNGLVRVRADGVRDQTFGAAGVVNLGGPNYSHVATAADGGIVLAGRLNAWRLSANGDMDTTFAGTGTATVDFPIRDVAVAADGKVLVAGSEDGFSQIIVVRLNPDGTPDATFGTNGRVVAAPSGILTNSAAAAVTALPDGRVLVAGVSRVPDGAGDFTDQSVLYRFKTDGTPDTTFSGTGRLLLRLLARSEARAVEVLPDGKILVSGAAMSPGGFQTDLGYLVRLNADGSRDTTFDGDGLQTAPGLGGFGGSLSGGDSFLATSASGGVGFVRYDANGKADPAPGGLNVSSVFAPGFSQMGMASGPGDKVAVVGWGLGLDHPAAAALLDARMSGVPDLQAASDSGLSSTDDITNDTTPTFDVVAPPAEPGMSVRLYRNGVAVGGPLDPAAPYTSGPLGDGVWTFSTTLVDAAGNESAPGAKLPVTVDTTPPKLQAVWAYGLVWLDPFFAGLNNSGVGNGVDGVALPTTTAEVPWGMINRLTLTLNEPVNHLARNDLLVAGTPAAAPAFRDFQADGRNKGGIWTFASNLPPGRLVLSFADTVADVAGNPMTGAGGAPYRYYLNILIGDGDRDGRVGPRDMAQVRARLNSSSAAPGAGARGYSPWFDFNADGKINTADYRIVRFRQGSALPPLPPAVQAVPPVRSTYSPVRAGVLTDDRRVLP